MMMPGAITAAKARAAAVFATFFFVPFLVNAQFVRGVVRDRAGMPVAGVVSRLLDSTSADIASSVSNARGEFTLRAVRAGMYKIQSLRIGYRATTSDAFAVPLDGTVSREVVLDDSRLLLETIRISAKPVCQSGAEGALATFSLWEQARAAITATRINTQSQSVQATALVYMRALEGSSNRVRHQTARMLSGVVSQPWATLPVDSLLKNGYVADVKDTVVYFAPGLDMLSSDAFLERHCLRITESADTSLIGIAFEPVNARKGYADINGIFWLDRKSVELRRMDFGYTNISAEQKRIAGGEIQFARLHNGGWAIGRWSIRMPMFVKWSGANMLLVETHVIGGELVLAVAHEADVPDTLWAHPPLQLRGTVTDSLTGETVSDARVSIIGTELSATTNTLGEFVVPDVRPGVYTLDVRSPVLSRIGAATLAEITLFDREPPLAIRVANPIHVLTSLCGKDSKAGAIVGRISSGVTNEPGANVRVVAQWAVGTGRGNSVERNQQMRSVETRTNDAGSFRICGIPPNQTVTVRATGVRSSSRPVEIIIPATIGILRVELELIPSPPTLPRPSSSVSAPAPDYHVPTRSPYQLRPI